MPEVSYVNLSNLHRNQLSSSLALIQLAYFANGPLRLQQSTENGVAVKYLGVRTWPTYFFEKIIGTPAQKTQAKLETRVAIDRYVRSFLNTPTLGLRDHSEAIVAALQSKVVRKSVLPKPVSAVGTNIRLSTEPQYAAPSVVKTKTTLFRGSGTVPTGLSFAVVSPLKIIADVRLVSADTYLNISESEISRGETRLFNETLFVQKEGETDSFKTYYLGQLNARTRYIRTSVVMEIEPDNGRCCSKAQVDGAWAAAKEFAQNQKIIGKHVSIMLTVPALPTNLDIQEPTARKTVSRLTTPASSILVSDTEDASFADE